MRTSAEEIIRVDSGNFSRVLAAAKTFDKAVYAGLRKQLRAAAQPLVDDIRANIRLIPTTGKHTRWGMRKALAAGTRAAIITGGKTGKGAGIRVMTQAKPVPYTTKTGPKLHGFPVAAFNAKNGQFGHPTFGDRSKWQTQPGRPYFGSVIMGRREDIAARIAQVLEDAARDLDIELDRRN